MGEMFTKQSDAIKNATFASTTIKTVSIPQGIGIKDVFDAQYNNALELMGGDRLLRPAASVNNVIIRKTSTNGVYKLILNNAAKSSFEVKAIDESELLNNRDYCAGTISKMNPNSYEVTYFDSEDEIVLEQFNKEEVIKFMNENRLVF